ncbi:MAG TPA: alpha-amylase family glycosyl hydrolase [Syntrophales bacterium]|nr:alpha-amylase family glycosyl hydrolase [Syntrophales bacterium]
MNDRSRQFNPITAKDIIYFAMTDRFCMAGPVHPDVNRHNTQGYHGGNFAGLISRIPYLKNLGVTALWITPVYLNLHPAQYNPTSNSWAYHGYWPYDFTQVDPHLYYPSVKYPAGDKRYLKEVADALHKEGIKLILDMVVNHTGYDHPGYYENDIPNPTPIRRGWFNPPREGWGEADWIFGLPDLNHNDPDVVRYFINDILGWIEQAEIDAIRMDTVLYVERHFWDEFKVTVHSKYPDVSLIGEVLDYDVDDVAKYMRYHDFNSVFDFPLQGAAVAVFAEAASCRKLARPQLTWAEPNGALDYSIDYTNPVRLVTLLDNHDLSRRFMTACLDGCGGDRKRAIRRFKMGLTFLVTTRGIPQIYYGTEIGMEGRNQPSDANMRQDMTWEVFDGGLEPTSAYPEAQEVFRHLRLLLQLRHGNEALQFSTPETLFVDDCVYVCMQEFRGNAMIIAFNNGRDPMLSPLTVQVDANPRLPQEIKTLLRDKTLIEQIDNEQASIEVKDGNFQLQLPGETSAVYKLP